MIEQVLSHMPEEPIKIITLDDLEDLDKRLEETDVSRKIAGTLVGIGLSVFSAGIGVMHSNEGYEDMFFVGYCLSFGSLIFTGLASGAVLNAESRLTDVKRTIKELKLSIKTTPLSLRLEKVNYQLKLNK